MSIDLSRLNGTTPVQSTSRTSSTKETSAIEATSAVSKTTAPSGEAVYLSDGAQKLQQISDSLRDQPTVNSARVAELKAAIADGSYQVDTQRVASKMINFEAQR
jgi:negative regulator of flagellin synthesis FlgM